MNEEVVAAGLDHILLLVTDLEASVGFYESVCGCQLRARLPQFGMVEMSAGENGIDLVAFETQEGAWAAPAARGGRNVDHFALSLTTSDARFVRRHLAARGVAVHEERVEDGRLSLYVRDPSGNVVELRLASANAA